MLNFKKIAIRIAGPVIDIFGDLKGETIIQNIEDLIKQLEDEEKSFDIMITSIRKVYGSEFADEVGSVARDASDTIHELLHKVVDPEFILSPPPEKGIGETDSDDVMETTLSQTNKPAVESAIDEMIAQYVEKGVFEDFDNAFTIYLDSYSTVREILDDLKKEHSYPELTKILKNAASSLERNRPDLVNLSSKDKALNEESGTHDPATYVALWFVQRYVEGKLPRLVEVFAKEQTEVLLKKFLNLVNLKFKKAISSKQM